MTLPDTREEIQDGNLAFAGDGGDDLLVIGPASGGVANSLYLWSDPVAPYADVGEGSGPDFASFLLEAIGGRVLYVKPTLSADTAPTVAQPSGTPPAVATTGAPLDAFAILVKITKAGAVGTSTFKLSIDGGDTWSPDILTIASYTGHQARTGLVFTFAAGTYVLGDVYTANTVGPSYTISDFNTALDYAKGLPYEPRVVHAVGIPTGGSDAAKAAAAAAFAANMQTKLASYALNDHLFMQGSFEGPDVANDSTGDTAIATALATVAAERVTMTADFVELRSPHGSTVMKRPAAWPFLARAMGATGGISEDPAEVKEGFAGRLSSAVSALRRDEGARAALNDQRITTLRTHRGAPGTYVTKGKTLAAAGSDFALWQHRLVIDEVCRVVRRVMLKILNSRQRCNADGTIYETDAGVIDQKLKTALGIALLGQPSHVSSFEASVVRTNNVLSTKQLLVKVNALPFAYPEQITSTIGFAALVARAA